MAYEHLGLRRWPFHVAPKLSFCDFIADRKQLRTDVENLLRTLSRQDASSIHLLWSWFGAGKTHTLFYIANRSRQISQVGSHLHTFYSEFPKSTRSFLDLYRAFAHSLEVDPLIEAYLEVLTSPDSSRLHRELENASPDLVAALQVVTAGKPVDQVTATRWLRGESLPIAQFRQIGISQKIGSSDEAGRILAALVHLLSLAAQSGGRSQARVIWLLDEFQRIEKLPPRVRDEITTGLHSTFNASPTGLTMMLSFSGHPQKNLPQWFSRELRDRIGRTKVLILPPMQPQEALEFVRDILSHVRTPATSDAPPYFPFTEESCRFIIESILEGEELKPRSIVHAFNAVLQEADPLIEAGEISVITPAFAKKVLAERVPLKDVDEE